MYDKTQCDFTEMLELMLGSFRWLLPVQLCVRVRACGVCGAGPEFVGFVVCRVDCMPIPPDTRRKNEDQLTHSLVDPKAHAGESVRPELDNVDASGEWSVRERPLRALVFV